MGDPRATGTLDERVRRLVVSLTVSGVALALLLACSSPSSGSDVVPEAVEPDPDATAPHDVEASDASEPDAAAPDPDAVIGAFQITLVPAVAATATVEAQDAYTWVIGLVNDGPTPSMIAWDAFHAVGDCTLYKPRAPFCEACPDGEVCIDEGVCLAYPTPQSVGLVTVTGVQTADGTDGFTMKPLAGNYQPSVELAYPGFGEGDPLAVTTEGSAFAAGFTLQAAGIAPLEVTTTSFVLTDGTPFPVAWTPAGPLATSRVVVSLEIAHHGGYKGRVDCDVADTGALEIPAELVDELKALGVAGFPTVSVTRSASDAVVLPQGTIELVVSMRVVMAVDIPGLVSCNDDTDCPDGQTCQDNLSCQ